MSYRTILVHVDGAANALRRYRMAAAIAARQSAHLTGVFATGVSRFIGRLNDEGEASSSGGLYPEAVNAIRRQAGEFLQDFERVATAAGIDADCQLLDDEAESGISLRARYADLVVVGQADRDDPWQKFNADLPATVARISGRPVLMVPRSRDAGGDVDAPGKHAVVAWDGSQSASRAIANAIALLKSASDVTLAVCNPGQTPLSREPASLAEMMAYLSRHGIPGRVHEVHARHSVGEALLDTAADLKADLLVAGCYGHTRFREVLTGGVSLTLMEKATVPVLMSH